MAYPAVASQKDMSLISHDKKLFPALGSSAGIKYFYMIYEYLNEDPCSFECVAMNMSTGESTPLTISPSPNTEKPRSIFLNFTAVAVGPTIYMIGGCCRYGFCPADVRSPCHRHAEVMFFDSLQPEKGWMNAPPMHIPRLKPTAVVIDGMIYVFGGSGREGLEDGECFDPETKQWRCFPAADFQPNFACIQVPYVGAESVRVLARSEYQDDETLHMYLLDKKKWEIVSRDFAKCTRPGAIVGDIIYSILDDDEEKPLHGYHLVHKRWFPVDLPEIKISTKTAWVFASGSDSLCLVWYHLDMRGRGKENGRGKEKRMGCMELKLECMELKLEQSCRRDSTTGSELLNLTATKVFSTYFRVKYITYRKSILAL